MCYSRKIVSTLEQRVEGGASHFIQIVVGPRQVGKTTAVSQLIEKVKMPAIYSAADSAGVPDASWINTKWQEARALIKEKRQALLVLDEVQLVKDWQSIVMALWDEDRRQSIDLHVVITGSSALLLRKGAESLAGRFEKHELVQWSYREMHEAFDFSLEQFLYFGGYPGAAPLIEDEERWKLYIKSSLIETVLTKDIIALSNISKPSLMQQLFKTICHYPAQIVAYNKLLGQLSDVGNVTTLSDYRSLLEDAYLLKVLPKWSSSAISQRSSKPKWIIYDNAPVTAMEQVAFSDFPESNMYGRLVENAVIRHLLQLVGNGFYWRKRNHEVDFVFY